MTAPADKTQPINTATVNSHPSDPQAVQMRLMRVLYEVATASESELDIALHHTVQSVAEALNMEAVAIQLVDRQRDVVRIVAQYPPPGPVERVENIEFSRRGTIVAEQFAAGPGSPPLILNDVAQAQIGPAGDAMRLAGLKSAILVPMFVQKVLVGSIVLGTLSAMHEFSPREVEVIQAIAGQIAVSIRNTQLLAEIEQRARQSERVAELGRQIGMMTDRLDIMRAAGTATPALVPGDGISVSLHQPGDAALELFLIDGSHVFSLSVPFEQAMLRTVYESGQSAIVNELSKNSMVDAQALARHALPGAPACDPLLESVLIVPLAVAGQIVGTYNLAMPQAGTYGLSETTAAEGIAAQLAVALENARLFTQTRSELQAERLRAQLSTVTNANDVAGLLLETTRGIGQAIGARRVRVRLVPPPERSE